MLDDLVYSRQDMEGESKQIHLFILASLYLICNNPLTNQILTLFETVILLNNQFSRGSHGGFTWLPLRREAIQPEPIQNWMSCDGEVFRNTLRFSAISWTQMCVLHVNNTCGMPSNENTKWCFLHSLTGRRRGLFLLFDKQVLPCVRYRHLNKTE